MLMFRRHTHRLTISFFVVLSLLLLPLIKGGFVGFQWARRMHGFGADAQAAARTKQAGAA